MRRAENGFAHLVLILAVLIVALAGFVGWRVYENQHKAVPVAVTPTSSSATSLNSTSQAVDNENINNDLDSASLDSDINSLL